MSALARNWKWLAATLIVAAAVHGLSVLAIPRVLMWRTMTGMARRAGGVNLMLHTPRPTAAARGVVRPSPDLLYSTCVFDLHGGPVHVHAADMPRTYWSVSLFDDETNNFHVINDRQAKSGGVDFFIVPPGEHTLSGAMVRAPSVTGVVLFRTLIDDDAHLAAIDAARRHAMCEAVKPGPERE